MIFSAIINVLALDPSSPVLMVKYMSELTIIMIAISSFRVALIIMEIIISALRHKIEVGITEQL